MIVGLLLNDLIETAFREPRLVARDARRGRGSSCGSPTGSGRSSARSSALTFPAALGIGAAQALALIPGVSRSGISISAGLFAGLDREAAARFAFLMATPITAGAGLWELRKIIAGEAGVELPLVPLLAGMAASLVAGLLAIAVLMRYLRIDTGSASSSSTASRSLPSSSSPGSACGIVDGVVVMPLW